MNDHPTEPTRTEPTRTEPTPADAAARASTVTETPVAVSEPASPSVSVSNSVSNSNSDSFSNSDSDSVSNSVSDSDSDSDSDSVSDSTRRKNPPEFNAKNAKDAKARSIGRRLTCDPLGIRAGLRSTSRRFIWWISPRGVSSHESDSVPVSVPVSDPVPVPDAARALTRPGAVLALSLASGLFAAAFGAGAQVDLDASAFVVAEPGAPGSPAELRAWGFARQQKLVEAREAAEAVLRDDPRSFVGHFVLGWAYHYGEANFPKALYHHEQAFALYTARHGSEPGPNAPWRWHARLLLELADTHGDLERHDQRLKFIARYNQTYDPDLIADQAWALMKLGRFDDARAAARAGLATGQPRDTEVALNALCAIEFEAGHIERSYEACRAALDHARTRGRANAVDLTNFAEASRSLFRLDEAERILQEATEAEVAWYGNPWLELAELYTRGARFPEALGALRKVPPYRNKRPPHVREADRNEHRRALASFYLVVGRPDEALRITDKALVAPDRRAHNSRDPFQDRAIVALVDRRARLAVAETRREAAVGEGVGARG